jgi:hypothetical protein
MVKQTMIEVKMKRTKNTDSNWKIKCEIVARSWGFGGKLRLTKMTTNGIEKLFNNEYFIGELERERIGFNY